MRVLINGISGHMGAEVAKLCKEGYRSSELVAGVDPTPFSENGIIWTPSFANACTDIDCVIDFSHHSCTENLLDFVTANKIPLVLATTGHTAEEKEKIGNAARQIPLFFASNYSIGIALLIELAKQAASVFPDAEIEIIEKHHDRKLDAPSGTALSIADAIREIRPFSVNKIGRNGQGKRLQNEIGIHSIRMGNIVGEHEVIIGTQTQTITLKHEAHSRALFAEGAIIAAEFILDKEPGLYTMKSLLKLTKG